MGSIRILAAAFALAIALPAAAQTVPQGTWLGRALDAAAAGDWARAGRLAVRAGDDVASDIVLWQLLLEGPGAWPDYRAFVARNGDWPAVTTLRRRAEGVMPAGLPPAQVIGFFAEEKPATGTGVLRLAEALVAAGRETEAAVEAVRGWREASFTRAEAQAMLARWDEALAPHHAARLDRLLWDGRTREAEAMLPLVSPEWQALARARIAVRRDADGSTVAIQAVPPAMRGDPGLAYERYLYRIDKGRWQEAEEYLLARSTSAEALGQPDRWMEHRADLARQALRRGDANAAYRLAAQNFGGEGPDFAEAEWLAGYLALTTLGEPALAVEHFRRFEAFVTTPISLGRAGYWLGLAFERAGEGAAAADALRRGAAHQTSFYGQLAAERAGIAPDPHLAGAAPAPDWRRLVFPRPDLVRAARLLHLAGEEAESALFLRAAAEGGSAATRAGLAQMARDLGRPQLGIRLAKDAAAAGIVLSAYYYPLHPIARSPWPVPGEYALAVARQESQMDEAAVSPAGALGLMQLMPGTAEDMARAANVAFEEARLTRDGFYNARLGTEYLSRMLTRYDGSYVLASAAYNAGPGRVDAWIRDFGDPRRDDTDAVEWIESIPFDETRNYVMRVLEGLHVYRARLKGEAVPIRLVADMNRTG